jgi:glycosyltransferase involved in cell wall biosynthesis
MGRFETTRNAQGMRSPANNERNTLYSQAFSQGVMEMAKADRARFQQGQAARLFIFAGFQNTLFEDIVTFEFHLTMGAFAAHIHHGTVRKISKFEAVREAVAGNVTIEEAKAKMDRETALDQGQVVSEKSKKGDEPHASWTPAPRNPTLGFNVIGYLTSHTGLGVAARNTIRLLRQQGYPVACLDIDAGLGRSGKDETLKGQLHDPTQPLPHRVNIYHMNPAEVGLLFRGGHPSVQPAGRMNVCVPFWELSRIPGNWISVLQGMDLVLAPTRFVQDAIGASVGGTALRYYPQAVDLPPEIKPNRQKWGLPENVLVFGFSFDFTSVMDRKNPIGVIQSFARAFPGRRDVRLVIKMNHSGALDHYKDIAARFKDMEKQNPQLKVIDASLPYAEVLDLMACWDVFVSLHRAEGLGLGLMESMGMGKAVMATGWSGNMDFMNDANGVLIKHRLIPVDPNSAYIGALNGEKNHVWADPDLDEAAFWMKRLADDPVLRQRLGQKAKADLHRRNAEALRGDVWEQVAQYYEGWELRRKSALQEAARNNPMPGDRGGKTLKVLFQNRPSAGVAPGGDTVVMNRYKDGLQKLGVHVDVDHDPAAPLGPYDCVHLFNLVLPKMIEPLARRAHEAGKPYFVQAFQEDQSWYLGKSMALTRLLAAYLQQGQKREMLPKLLELMKMAETVPTDTSVWTADHAEAVLVCSEDEAQTVRSLQPASKPVILPYGADVANASIGPELFEKAYGVKDFILCVGRLEARKNQLALLAALEFEDIPIVFADGGVCYAPDYANLCRYFKRKAPTVYTGRLDKEMLVSAYRAARAHVLPSWYELPGLVSIEAALYGCNIAATPRGGLRDYLGDTVDYFEPDDLEGVRRAALNALHRPRNETAAAKARPFTWQATAEKLKRFYEATLLGTSGPTQSPLVHMALPT